MPDNRPILVLGADGFIGRALMAHLARAGVAAIGATRRDTGTLEASSDWSALLDGCRAVVHLASLAHAPAAGTAWIEAEAATGAALAAAARGAGIERIVLMSSIKVHGDDTGAGRFHASDRPAPGDDYGRCKLAIEQAMAAEGGRLVVLRPPLVYGPGVKGNFLALLRRVAAGVPLPLAGLANRRSVVFLDNLMDLIAIALSDERADGAYLVRDDDEVSTPMLVRMIARGLGRRARLFPCPPALLLAGARLAGRTEAALRPPPGRARGRRPGDARCAGLAACASASPTASTRPAAGSAPSVAAGRPLTYKAAMAAARGKLIFLVTEDWYFWSHRLPMARAARDAGFEVAVATRVTAHGERIRAEGFALHPLRWRRRSIGPGASLAAIIEIVGLYRRERPLLVHHVALKAALLGGVVAALAGVPAVVSMIAGAGGYPRRAPARPGSKRRILAQLTRRLWPMLLLRRRCRVIVQNEEDRADLVALRPEAAARVAIIAGSGIDLARFEPAPAPPEPPVVVAYAGRMIAIKGGARRDHRRLRHRSRAARARARAARATQVVVAYAGRMIAIKGVATLVAAQQSLRRQGLAIRLVLAGAPDPENPSAIDAATLAGWAALPGVTWLGHQDDVRPVWAASHIAALASLGGEGLPKSLLEAAAMARPIVATDVPGTRAIARAGRNAILVPPGDEAALAAALGELVRDPDRRRRFAAASRDIVEQGFSDAAVGAATVALYCALLDEVAASGPGKSASLRPSRR